MDAQSEHALIARLDAELAGRTLVLVTHRQSMLRLATRVIVIDRGRIALQGPRDDVLRAPAAGQKGVLMAQMTVIAVPQGLEPQVAARLMLWSIADFFRSRPRLGRSGAGR